jgi:squalene synthase HpnC
VVGIRRSAALPRAVPGRASQLEAMERRENFPVALRVLPRDVRADLRAVYDVVRTIDELGDAAPGNRTAALTRLADDLDGVWTGGPTEHPVLIALRSAVQRRNLPREPFDRLVAANLADQRVTRYATFADLLAYCDLSAAPVGRLVLALFGQDGPEQRVLSDRICAGLQVVEHLQDVGEDRRAGRVYLPQADLRAFGVAETDLDAPTASPAVRRLVLAELDRVTGLFDAGAPLLPMLHGWARLAVACYLAGGRAAAAAVRRVDGDVLGGRARARRRDVLADLLRSPPRVGGGQPVIHGGTVEEAPGC